RFPYLRRPQREDRLVRPRRARGQDLPADLLAGPQRRLRARRAGAARAAARHRRGAADGVRRRRRRLRPAAQDPAVRALRLGRIRGPVRGDPAERRGPAGGPGRDPRHRGVPGDRRCGEDDRLMPPARHRVVVRAPGKINLSLGVGAVDERGYHALATVFQAVDLYETITAVRAEELSLEVSSDVPGEVPLDGTNLALQAAELLRAEFSLREGAALHINKQVPIAGGMGGGSADAAATLVALDRLWGLGLSGERLRRLGARLGADVPFAMLGHTALGRGNGADLTTVLTHGEWTWLLAVQ